MKKVFYVVCLLCTFLFIDDVKAYEKFNLTCEYNFSGYELAGIQGGKVICEVYNKNFTIFNSGNKTVVYSCKSNGKKISIKDVNDADDIFLNTRACPGYALYNGKYSNEIYFFKTSKESQDKQSSLENPSYYLFSNEKESKPDENDTRCNNYSDNINNDIKHLEDQVAKAKELKCEEFDLTEEERETIADLENVTWSKDCLTVLDASVIYSTNAKTKLNDYVVDGCLQKNSTEYNNFLKKIDDANNTLKKQKEDIEAELKKPETIPGASDDEWLANPTPQEKIDNCAIVDKNGSFYKILSQIIGYVQIGTIFIVILLSGLDFVSAITSGDDDAFKKAIGKSKNRIIALVLVFLVPALVNLLLTIVNVGACDSENDFVSELFNK